MVQNINKKIYEVGWEIIDSSNFENLKILRSKIYEIILKEFELEEQDPDIGLNNFHKILKQITDSELNQKKVNVIQKISGDKKLVNLIFESFCKDIEDMLGKDLLVQKTINLVIQTPKDLNPTIPHRDAPPNSYFELVIWIPLVDCKDTKSMVGVDFFNSEINLT